MTGGEIVTALMEILQLIHDLPASQRRTRIKQIIRLLEQPYDSTPED